MAIRGVSKLHLAIARVEMEIDIEGFFQQRMALQGFALDISTELHKSYLVINSLELYSLPARYISTIFFLKLLPRSSI
jgi:hypothetical protein